MACEISNLSGPRGLRAGAGRESVDGAYALDVRGRRHAVVITGTPPRTRPGDILLAEPAPVLVFRPATHRGPPAGVPDDAVRLAVDERGTAWSLDQSLTEAPDRVVRQRDGRTLGSTAVPRPYAGGALTARGGTAALSLLQADDLRGLLVTTDAGGHWRTVLDGGVPWRGLKRGPEFLVLELLADGRLPVGEEGGRYWLADDRGNLPRAAGPCDVHVVRRRRHDPLRHRRRDDGDEWRRHERHGHRSPAEVAKPSM